MKNSGTVYYSTEKQVKVCPELRDLLPPLSEDQRNLLKEDILKNGCIAPIVVMEDLTVVDGHHRMKICEENNVDYKLAVFSFESLLEAKEWALNTQKARRNLSTWEIGQIVLKLKTDLSQKSKEQQGTRTDLFQNSEKGLRPSNTTKALANAAEVSTDTMNKIIQIDKSAPDYVKKALDEDKISINKGYEITKGVKDVPDSEREKVAEKAVMEAAYSQYSKEVDKNAAIAKSVIAAVQKPVEMEPSEENARLWLEFTGAQADAIDAMIWQIDQAVENLFLLKVAMEELKKPKLVEVPLNEDSERCTGTGGEETST